MNLLPGPLRRSFGLALFILLSITPVECSRHSAPTGPEDEPAPPTRILFVGNSLTFYNGGLNTYLAGILSASDSLSMITAESSAFAGYTLQNHWNSNATMSSILNGNWDAVVLQEHSTRCLTHTENMYVHARLLNEEIRESGARTVFFMTWAPESDPDAIEDIDTVYRTIAGEMWSTLVPVGRAWQRSREEEPDLSLHDPDGLHPNYHGTYLAACVFYAALWRRSPEGNTYRGHSSINEEERAFLQRIAWETVQAEKDRVQIPCRMTEFTPDYEYIPRSLTTSDTLCIASMKAAILRCTLFFTATFNTSLNAPVMNRSSRAFTSSSDQK